MFKLRAVNLLVQTFELFPRSCILDEFVANETVTPKGVVFVTLQ